MMETVSLWCTKHEKSIKLGFAGSWTRSSFFSLRFRDFHYMQISKRKTGKGRLHLKPKNPKCARLFEPKTIILTVFGHIGGQHSEIYLLIVKMNKQHAIFAICSIFIWKRRTTHTIYDCNKSCIGYTNIM